MPRRLVTTDGSTFRHAPYDTPRLGPQDVRVRVELASPKHGTEGHALAGSAFATRRWDPDLRIFLPAQPGPAKEPSERGIGNMVVGAVEEIGAEVARWRPGDRVYGYGAIQEVAVAPEGHWHALNALSPESAVCVDPAHVAFVAMRDGNVRIGDHVAVFGLGAIGLMAVQTARCAGARRVFAVDPAGMRRDCAARTGAELALDPSAVDAALEIKRATSGAGVDVAIETSGSGRALHESIRCIRQCGTVVHVPWGPRDCSALHLDEEFHLNRPTIVGSQAWDGWGNPDRSYPLWDYARAYAATIELFEAGLLTGNPVVTPTVTFEDAPAVVTDLFRSPDRAIKLGVRFAS